MLIKVHSVNQVSESNFLNHFRFSYVEMRQFIKLLGIILVCALIGPSLLMFYQVLEAKPAQMDGNYDASKSVSKTNEDKVVELQHLPSYINNGIVEMGPFLVPICNILNENSEINSHTKNDRLDVNANELISMVETKK
ncbi:MAG: hypothetical protein PSX81_08755 [bacterium]|nr:hypothetical protein [bacterium]